MGEPLLVQAGSEGNKIFGFLLGTYRDNCGLSPQQLADAAGVHASFVRGIERGVQAPSLETAFALLSAVKHMNEEFIQWMDEDEYCDLVLTTPTGKTKTAFIFKALKVGQNRRPDLSSESSPQERLRLACLDRAISFCLQAKLSASSIVVLAKEFEEFVLREG